MINSEIVYKIKLTGLEKHNPNHYKDGWVTKVNVIPYTGGSGKTWTSKNLVEKNLAHIKDLTSYGTGFTAEIIAFTLKEIPYK